jgi:flavodoxin
MKVKIVFETQTGTTQYVAEIIQKQLQAAGHTADLHSIKYQGQTPDFTGYDMVLFGAPTYEDGKLENTMRIYITKTTLDMSKMKVAVFGLGNSFYPLFCKSADALEEWVKKNNGAPLIPALRVDGFPDNLEPITSWTAQLIGKAQA